MEQKNKKNVFSKYDKTPFFFRNRHDSKFHKYGVRSNFDNCFKNVQYVTIII